MLCTLHVFRLLLHRRFRSLRVTDVRRTAVGTPIILGSHRNSRDDSVPFFNSTNAALNTDVSIVGCCASRQLRIHKQSLAAARLVNFESTNNRKSTFHFFLRGFRVARHVHTRRYRVNRHPPGYIGSNAILSACFTHPSATAIRRQLALGNGLLAPATSLASYQAQVLRNVVHRFVNILARAHRPDFK